MADTESDDFDSLSFHGLLFAPSFLFVQKGILNAPADEVEQMVALSDVGSF